MRGRVSRTWAAEKGAVGFHLQEQRRAASERSKAIRSIPRRKRARPGSGRALGDRALTDGLRGPGQASPVDRRPSSAPSSNGLDTERCATSRASPACLHNVCPNRQIGLHAATFPYNTSFFRGFRETVVPSLGGDGGVKRRARVGSSTLEHCWFVVVRSRVAEGPHPRGVKQTGLEWIYAIWYRNHLETLPDGDDSNNTAPVPGYIPTD